jgi:hypothetical protein
MTTPSDRERAVKLFLYFQYTCQFKIETFFTAVNILDRYLSLCGPNKFSSIYMEQLAVVCFTLAGKIEEKTQPSFANVTRTLSNGANMKREDLLTI